MTSLSELLISTGPDPRYEGQLMTFGRFVGSWDLEVTDFHPDGTADTYTGEWHFGWVLNGRAVQDVWVCPSRSEQQRLGVGPLEWGTAVRYYEPLSDSWRVSWSGPHRNRQILFVAREQSDEIVLEGEEKPGTRLRWIFSEITDSSFRWRAVEEDRGDWRLLQEMCVRRRERR